MTYAVSRFSISVTDKASVTAEVFEPKAPIAVFLFAHGAGAGMNHSFMCELAATLADVNIATMRFNFLYMERGKKRPDSPAIAHEAIKAAIDKSHAIFPSLPLFAGGKSFGGRMTSQFVAANKLEFLKGIIFVGFPLHLAKKPSTQRAEHLSQMTLPILFLQGTKDALAEWNLVEDVCKNLPTATLIKFEGADHSFKMPKQHAVPLLADAILKWISGIVK